MHLLLMLATLLFASPTPETCDGIHALVGGELVEWVGYPQGWQLPADLKKIGRVDFASGGAWAYHSESDQARYIVVFASYEQTTGADGEHFGAHSFCGPYRIADDDQRE
jgi:hypothetical protein